MYVFIHVYVYRSNFNSLRLLYVYLCMYVCVRMYNVCLYHLYIRDVLIGRRIVMINVVIGVAFD